MYHLVVEDLQLNQRKAEKESTGSAIRLKQSGKQVSSSYTSYALPGFGGLCFVSNPNLSRMDSYEAPFQQPSYKMGVPVYLSCTKAPPGDLCSPANLGFHYSGINMAPKQSKLPRPGEEG